MLLEHDRCSVHLIFLNDAVKRIITYGVNSCDIKILYDTIEFILNDVKENYNFEENNIYPYLINIYSGELVSELKSEHEMITKITNELKIFLDEIDINRPGEIVKLILKNKSKLVAEILSGHIKKENDLIHKTAKQIFNERDFYYLFKVRKEKV
jgi:hemerythrin-like domain-containing protein